MTQRKPSPIRKGSPETGTPPKVDMKKSPAATEKRGKFAKTRGPRGRHRQPEKIYDFIEADNRIFDIFSHHGFQDFPHDKRQDLTRFYRLLMEHQQKNNVTRLLSLRDVAIKHFIDSLIVTQFVNLTFPLLDMGTGPGFPGIPLKILFPEKPIILAEGVEKRVQFLKKVREDLGLKDLQVIGRNITPEFAYPVAGVITRAVSDISETLLNVSNCLQPGGAIYLMKGPSVDTEIEQAHKRLGELFRLEKDVAYELPSTPHRRRLLVYRKLKSSQDKPF